MWIIVLLITLLACHSILNKASLITSSTNSLSIFFLTEIEKQFSHSNALEHLESSGIIIFIKGPIVCKLCVRRKIHVHKQEQNIFLIKSKIYIYWIDLSKKNGSKTKSIIQHYS